MSEKIVKTIRVYGKDCIGCRIKEKDVMLSYNTEDFKALIGDLFLTQEMAENLLKELGNVLTSNKEGVV